MKENLIEEQFKTHVLIILDETDVVVNMFIEYLVRVLYAIPDPLHQAMTLGFKDSHSADSCFDKLCTVIVAQL